jgi:tRNA pseudouridine38-40 synthase
VGCLVYVGKSEFPPEWLGELLAGRDRTRAAPTFAAAGLYLAQLEYGPHWGLPVAPRANFMELCDRG